MKPLVIARDEIFESIHLAGLALLNQFPIAQLHDSCLLDA
jgi:hypothetical protein